MDTQSKIDAIKKLLGLDFAAPMPEIEAPETEPTNTVETEKATATAKDGTIVSWEGELMVGSELTVTTPEGEKPAPDGAMEFEDGTIIEVSGGKVTSLTPSAQAPAPEQGMEDARFNEMNEQFTALKAELTALTETMKAELATVKEAFSKTVDLVQEFNNTPTQTPKAPVNDFFKKQTKTDNLEVLASAIKGLTK